MSRIEEVHAFAAERLWPRIRTDVRDLRVFNRPDLMSAAYFHTRHLLLTQPGWSLRAGAQPGTGQSLARPDLVLYHRDVFQAVFQFECCLSRDPACAFPAADLDAAMHRMRQVVIALEAARPASTPSGSAGRGYLLGVFDTPEPWFYPDSPVWEKQSCFWLPVNCREFPDHAEWRAKWDKSAGHSL